MMSLAFSYGGEAREIKGDRSLPGLMVHLKGDRGYSLFAVGSNVKFCYKNRAICIKKLHLP
jgi:hypothetical protein